MSCNKLKQNISISSNSATITIGSCNTIHNRRRIMQNCRLIWMDSNIDQSDQECQNILAQLRNIVYDLNIFTEWNQCVDFLTEIDDATAFLIASNTLGKQIIPLIHDIPQLDTIYIFSHNESKHEKWSKEWIKIKGVHTEIVSVCKTLQQDIKQRDQNYIPMSFISNSRGPSNENLNQLEPSFMYTQILKEIILEMEHNQQSIQDFITYCRKGDFGSPITIDRFESEYDAQRVIWWYTYPSFIFSLLNSALRTLEADTIINMGFFIHDLHHQIQELYHQQVSSYCGRPFIVYRGQGLSTHDFEKLQKTTGGLMSFNSFLSTSKKREVSLPFVESVLTATDMIGILFEIIIDPSVSSTPFAAIRDVSYYDTEEEILFSMHTVFHIGKISKISENNALYQVELKLTPDDDEQLRILTEHIREATGSGTGWAKLSTLLMIIGQLGKSEELFKILIEQTSDEDKKVTYYNNLGHVKNNQGDYQKAFGYFEQGLEIKQKTLLPNHPSLAISYNNIGRTYLNMGEYSKALSLYGKALEIQQKALSSDHPEVAISYSNIGSVYGNMGEYSKALSFHEQALKMFEKTLPSNHPDLATSYNNIAGVYDNMGEYSKAHSYYEKALKIRQKSLSPNHPDIAISYSNIGLTYYNTRQHSKALLFYEKALEIYQKTLPSDHPHLATTYNNIAGTFDDMEEYPKALSFYEKALEIRQKILPPNHPSLAGCYNNIGLVYYNMEENSKALSFHEKALEIRQKTLPSNHPHLAMSYNNIASVYFNMKEYAKALSYFERALDIRQYSLPPNHPQLLSVQKNIEIVRKEYETLVDE